MSRLKDRRFQGLIVTAVCGLALLVACSTDSPTAPLQVPPPPTDGGGSDDWNITVSVSPSRITAGGGEGEGGQPTTVTVKVRDRITGANPVPGSTIALRSTLGEFDFSGSEARSTFAVIEVGNASALLFPGETAGTATVSADYQGSTGRTTLQISTGNAFISSVSPSSGPEAGGTNVRISGVGLFGPLRVLFDEIPGSGASAAADGTSVSVRTPAYTGDWKTEECEKDGSKGTRYVPTPVTVKVEGATTDGVVLANGFFYNPSRTGCDISGGG